MRSFWSATGDGWRLLCQSGVMNLLCVQREIVKLGFGYLRCAAQLVQKIAVMHNTAA